MMFDKYVVVIGGVNMDIGGASFAPVVMRDSNPGRVTTSLGGVGRNIAHNLTLLGIRTAMLTALGDDAFADRIMAASAKIGLDMSRALTVKGAATSTYVYLNDAGGDMVLAVSDMAVCEYITPEYVGKHLGFINASDAVVIDANLPMRTIEYIAQNVCVPIFCDPVSTVKASKLVTSLDKIHTLKPNKIEAQLLSGVAITDDESVEKAAQKLIEKGTQRVYISLGERGVYAADKNGGSVVPSVETKVVSTTGAGDAFSAALVWAYLRGASVKLSAKAAVAASSMACRSRETINEAITAQRILEMI